MKKPLLCAALSVATLLGIAQPALAQTMPTTASRPGSWCATDEHNAALERTYYNPQLAAEKRAAEALSARLQNDDVLARQLRGQRRPSGAASRIVPVVIHVVTACGNESLIQSQILAGMEQVNRDFTRTNADTVNTRSIFRPYASNLDIEFRLAKLDPQGNPTSGIHRVTDVATDAINPRDLIKSAVPYWDGYFNVWIVDEIYSPQAGSIILGYAQFPGTGPWNTWGLVMRYDDWTANPISNGRTASHEMGHCFNLFHVFTDGGGCGTSCTSSCDRVCDTPPSASSSESCSPRNTCSNEVSSGTVYTTNVPDQDENFMSYSACQNMFSLGQRARVDAAFQSFTYMSNLISPANLLRTGVADGQVIPPAPPVAYLNSCQIPTQAGGQVACVNRPVTFVNASYGDGITGVNWNFGPDATPSTSTAAAPAVTFSTPGLHIVTLTATNAAGTSAPLQIPVRVLPYARVAPLMEGFEGSRLLEDSTWRVESSSPGSSRRWRLIGFPPGVTTEGDTAIMIANGNNVAGTVNTLYSPAFDTRNLATSAPTPALEFDIAYSRRNTSGADDLKVAFSADCGRTWITRRTLSGANLSTTGTQTIAAFVPQSLSQWRTESINLTGPFFNQGSFMVRFQSTTQVGGNNLYLDNIRLTGRPLGVTEALAAAGVALAPNPLTDQTALAFDLDRATRVAVRVTDMLGRPVLTDAARTLVPGRHTIGLADRMRGAAAGVYVVMVELDGRSYTQKLLVQ